MEGGRCGFESELLLPSEWKDKAGLNCGFCSSDNALQKEQRYPNTVFTPTDQKCLSQSLLIPRQCARMETGWFRART